MTAPLFALDIGTRSVVGIILKEMDGKYHVNDLLSVEHRERAMIDGQIHNILSVADVIQNIKEELEQKHGPLKRVSVAAAGRALKTSVGSMTIDIFENTLFSNEDINRLELAAVQEAQQKLIASNPTTNGEYYYCVGYSVLHYKLDGEPIGSLIDQSGRNATIEVIATFLPQVVVESLLSALKRADLEMEALTLEPIAAIHVLIPPSMRRLNVALVDIGAGTSDIAITDNNTVVAYGMVPIAGDEITEAFSNHYLLDFNIAEIAKRKLVSDDAITITDILGFEQDIPSVDAIKVLRPNVQLLATSIADEIRRLNNQKSPQAVMLVGGGSLTPLLTIELSRSLDLPENRVAIRSLDALSEITLEPGIQSSPDLVTPIGIAIAARRSPIHYMSVTVNERPVRLFELKEMTVGDALLAANIKAKQLYGKPGLGMSLTVNGNDLIVPGEHGRPSTILLNGQPANTKDKIKNEDKLELIPGVDGKDATVTVSELFDDLHSIQITIDGKPIKLEPQITINGELKDIHTVINDRDTINVSQARTLKSALQLINQYKEEPFTEFTIYVNNKPLTMSGNQTEYRLNNQPILQSYLLKEGDHITVHYEKPPTLKEVARKMDKEITDEITVYFNGEKTSIRKKRFRLILNGQVVDGNAIVKANDKIELVPLQVESAVFGDVFAFTDYQLPKQTTGNYHLLRNGETIGFNDPIFEGDQLTIEFD